MVLGVFSLLRNAIASINDNDITDHKILSILYEQYCKVCTCTYELYTGTNIQLLIFSIRFTTH